MRKKCFSLLVAYVGFSLGLLAQGDGLAAIQGRYVGAPPPRAQNAAQASAKATQVVLNALGKDGNLRSETADKLPGCLRGFTWGLPPAAQLFGVTGHVEVNNAVQALLRRQLQSGAFPVMVCVDNSGLGDPKPGLSETVNLVTHLARLANRGVVSVEVVKPSLLRALAWLETLRLPNGGYAIQQGSTTIATESLALQVSMGIELNKLLGCCRQDAITAARLLASLWLGDHFARGIRGDIVDSDSLGPHTHQAITVIALVAAERAFPGETPSAASHDPTDWMMKFFRRTNSSGGRLVQGLGDRLVLVDQDGLVYGCDGGLLGESGALLCPAGTIRKADPSFRCYSPSDSCATAVDSIPSSATVVQSVNAEITILYACAALALGRENEARFLINGGIAMQANGGGIIAIAGPKQLKPGLPAGYSLTLRKIQTEYTAMFALMLLGVNPFSADPLSLPSGLDFTPHYSDDAEIVLTALFPDPDSGHVVGKGLGGVDAFFEKRKEDWVRLSTELAEDLWRPAACVVLSTRIGFSGWSLPEIKISGPPSTDPTQPLSLTHGRRLYGITEDRLLNFRLHKLKPYWGQHQNDDDPLVLAGVEFALVRDVAAADNLDRSVSLRLSGMRLVPGDCIEGTPPVFRKDDISLDAEANRVPTIQDTTFLGDPALRADYSLDNERRWIKFEANDRYRWPCAEFLELRYAASEAVRLQIIIQDSQIGSTGARYFSEATVPGNGTWNTWRVKVADLRPFDSSDNRRLNWNRLRGVSIAIVPGASSSGTLFLDKLQALAPSTVLRTDGSCLKQFAIDDRGSESLSAPTPSSSDVQVAWGKIQVTSGEVLGLLRYSLERDGVVVSETSVLGSAAITAGLVPVINGGRQRAGIGISNPNKFAVVVSCEILTSLGEIFRSSFTIAALSQIASFIDESPFNGPALLTDGGTLSFASSAPVAAIALLGSINERGDFLITPLQIIDLNGEKTAGPVLVPHWASGTGWTSKLFITNPTDGPLGGSIALRDPEGKPAATRLGGASGPLIRYQLAARGMRIVEISGDNSLLMTGSALVMPDPNSVAPVVVVHFSYRSAGITLTEAAINAIPSGFNFRTLAEASGAFGEPDSFETGIAIATASDSPLRVTIDVTTVDGMSATGYVDIPANGKRAFFVSQISGLDQLPAALRGTVRISSPSPVSVVGLRGLYNKRNEFLVSALPAADENVRSVRELFFAHVVSGGGYATNLIFFNGTAASSSGTLQFFSKSGTELPWFR